MLYSHSYCHVTLDGECSRWRQGDQTTRPKTTSKVLAPLKFIFLGSNAGVHRVMVATGVLVSIVWSKSKLNDKPITTRWSARQHTVLDRVFGGWRNIMSSSKQRVNLLRCPTREDIEIEIEIENQRKNVRERGNHKWSPLIIIRKRPCWRCTVAMLVGLVSYKFLGYDCDDLPFWN